MRILINLLITLALCGQAQAESEFEIKRISLHEATQTILNDDHQRVLGATTELIEDKEVHVIRVLTPDGHIRHYKIDAETGEIIE